MDGSEIVGTAPSEDVGDAGAFLFLSGAEMEPSAVLAAAPGARFVARARLGGEEDAEAGGEEAVWGILVRVPAGQGATEGGQKRAVTTDDGRSFRAAVVGDGRPRGAAAEILAAARYWELPPAYVRLLAGAVDPESD